MFPLRITFPFSRKMYAAMAVVLVSVVLSGLFIYEVYAQPLPQTHHASAAASVPAGTVYLSPSAHAAAVTPAAAPMLEVHIANNGLVLLRGARVLSISGSTLRVGMTWDSSDFVWNVETAYNTAFFAGTGAKATLADIQTGDIVSVTGMLSAGGAEPGIKANYVRE